MSELRLGEGYEQEDPGVYIANAEGLIVYSSDVPITPEFGRRIVACVNACQGLSTQWLEQRTDAQSDTTFPDGIFELSKQRDELLDLVASALPFVEMEQGHEAYKPGVVEKFAAEIRAAIAPSPKV